MPHHVYANDNEICAKSADGTSDLAPDTCFSPGAPYPGVPILYTNSCKASDVANGSRTVSIKNAEVCLEDKSYFARSYGDEAATQGLKKGLVSNSVQGKCRFIGWSPNVSIEGLAVTRHLDMLTHNHNSPANTPPTPYISKKAAKGDCKDDIAKMKRECKPDTTKKSMLERALGPKKYAKLESILKKAGADPNSWIGSHCDGLMVKPVSGKAAEEFASKIEEMSGDLDKIIADEIKKAIDSVKKDIQDKALSAAGTLVENKLENAAIRHSAALVGLLFEGVGVVVTEAAATVLTTGDTVVGLAQGAGLAYEAWDTLDSARSVIDSIPSQMKDAIADARSNPQKAMANFMSVLARMNACARARRCILAKYEDTETAKVFNGNGCCPGQTGHHILPGEMFYDRPNCPKYSRDSKPHREAPTICVEGTGNEPTVGTHGAIHERFAEKIKNYRTSGWFQTAERETIDYAEAREMGIDSVRETFPESGCDAKCLRAQLDKFYAGVCSPNTLNARTGMKPNWLEKKIKDSSPVVRR